MTASSPDIAIRVNNVSKMFKIYPKPADMFWELLKGKPRYHPFWALRDISFEVKRGQVVGIIGRNGAGKSTLLKIISGTLDKSSGEVAVKGRLSSILELGSGFSGEYTGRENIYLGGLIVGLTREEINRKIDWIIEFSELGSFIDQAFKTYSTGMQARLTFSTAVCIDPDILIIDEALAVGDAKFSRKCYEKIDDFRKAGHTILLVSHDINTISAFCNHAILLENGQIFEQGEPRRIGTSYFELLFGSKSRSAVAVSSSQSDHSTVQPIVETAPVQSACEEQPPQHGADTAPSQPISESAPDGVASEIKGNESAPEPRSTAASTIVQPSSREARRLQWKKLAIERLHRMGREPSLAFDQNAHELRSGSQKAFEIVDLGVRDAAGKSVRLLESGKEYDLFLVALFYEPVARTSYGFQIRNMKGMDIYGIDSQSAGLWCGPHVPGELFEARLHVTMWLTNGDYFLGAGLGTGEALSYDFRFDAVMFTLPRLPWIQHASLVNLQPSYKSEKLTVLPLASVAEN